MSWVTDTWSQNNDLNFGYPYITSAGTIEQVYGPSIWRIEDDLNFGYPYIQTIDGIVEKWHSIGGRIYSGKLRVNNVKFGREQVDSVYSWYGWIWKNNNIFNDYLPIAYVESTGTQGINTGYSVTSGSVTLKADIEFTALRSGDNTIFGTWDDDNHHAPHFG